MFVKKDFWRNPNLYTAMGMFIVFLWLSGIVPSMPSPITIQNKILNFIVKAIFVVSSGASIAFIFGRFNEGKKRN